MLQTQQTFLDYLDAVQAELGRAGSGGLQENIQAIERLKQELAAAELIVPVVGAFSAGKSTLINSFLGAGPLPVGITPETALATELRHSTEEYVEVVAENGEVNRFALAEIGAINEQAAAADYQYAKVFLDSEPLEGIAPLVFVDMPGFDSPRDLHQRAILTYLSRGSHYAVLISVEEGTVTRSLQRQLTEFNELGRGFSLFLSKANLRPASEVAAIAGNIEERLKDDFDFGGSVVPVDMAGGQSLAKMLHAIDPEGLFGEQWHPGLEAHFLELDGRLNTRISSLQKDERENQEAIDEIAAGLGELQRKKEEMIADVRARYSTNRIDAIVEGVGEALGDAVEELTELAMSGGEDALQRELWEIVRTSFVSQTEAEMGRLRQQIAEDLVDSLKDISSTLSSYDNDISKVIANKGLAASGFINEGPVVLIPRGPLIDAIMLVIHRLRYISILPYIIDFFNKRWEKKKIRNQLTGTVIPFVKRTIRSEWSKDFDAQVNALINGQAEVLGEHIRAKQKEIAVAERAKQDELRDIEQTIAELTSIRDHIRSLADQALFAHGETKNGS